MSTTSLESAAPQPCGHALVTGASKGIGAAIAERLWQLGWQVSCMGRSLPEIEATHALRMQAVQGDVTELASIALAFDAARARFGPISALINNAGQVQTAPVHKMELSLWQNMLAVNLTGTLLCTQAALPDLLQAPHARIVNIASTAGLTGYAYVSAYCAAKHGVIGLTRALALELAQKGVTVNAVCPGYTETDIVRAGIANIMAQTGRSEAAARATVVAHNPQGRLVQPSEVAETVAWLCHANSDAVTGQAIAVCGGEVMR